MTDPPVHLTPRQMAVLQTYGEVLTFRGVADRLFLSVFTVKTHAAEIRAVLGVSSLCEAVIKGLREGWLQW